MTFTLVVPLLIALIASAVAARVQTRLRPSTAARLLTGTAVVSALAVLWALLLAVVGALAQIEPIADRLEWCRTLYPSDHAVPPLIAFIALVALGTGTWRAQSKARLWKKACRSTNSDLEILPTNETVCYAMPGEPGHVVVSAGLLALLATAERDAVLAHEYAHLRHHHHRLVRAAEIAAAAVPIIAPLARRVRFATERWADEDAADAVGDRQVVAKALALTALTQTESRSTPEPGLLGSGVGDRVTALVSDPTSSPLLVVMATAAALVSTTSAVAGSTIQLHHLVEFVAHVCGAG